MSAARSTLAAAIEAFLRERPGRAFKTKELARHLGCSKQGEEYQRLKEALRELSATGRVSRIEGRKWGVPPPPESAAEGQLRAGMEDARGNPETERRTGRSGSGAVSRTGGAGESAKTPRRTNQPGSTGEATGRRSGSEGHRQGATVVGTFRVVNGRGIVQFGGRHPLPDLLIPASSRGGARDGDRVVALVREEGRAGVPHGSIEDVLGPEGHPAVELEALARRHGLSLEFPEAVEAAAAACPSRIPKAELARRLDLRGIECVTIDPVDARDHDDAVSLEMDEAGNYRLGVHIADVSYYVQPGDALDREALARGTSVYLVDGVIPMLPERLSNDICSLKERRDRLTFSALMTVSPRGVVLGAEFRRSVIRSARSFSYERVQQILDSGSGPHAVMLGHMAALASVLHAKRLREGSIDFDLPEVRVVLDPDGVPEAIIPRVRLQSMRLIEECMLLANRCVASAVRDLAGRDAVLPFIYRVHDLPDPEKVEELRQFLRHMGIRSELDPASSRSFQRMLESITGLPEADVVQDVTIRSMAKAVYSEKNIGHFGLAFPHYTHFTSPIRRYPDLMVHRLLAAYLDEASPVRPWTREQLSDIARHASERERIAVDAERESVRIKELEYMQRHLGDVLDAVISGVTSWGVYVEVTGILVEGLVHVRTLGSEYLEFDGARRELIGRRSGIRFGLGDRVRVQVARIDPVEKRIDFELVEHAASGEPAAHGRRQRRHDAERGGSRRGGR